MFFNGNTFAEIGRALTNALFHDLPFHRRREAASAAAHYITGVLDRELMIQLVNELSASAALKPGDRVKTLKGSVRGTILRTLKDGRVVVKTDTGTQLTALPESLLKLRK